MIDFRRRVKELCAERGITQKELAHKMGITDISLNKTLRGQYPQLQSLENIANALGVEISDLFVVTPPEQVATSMVLSCPHCGKPLAIGLQAVSAEPDNGADHVSDGMMTE